MPTNDLGMNGDKVKTYKDGLEAALSSLHLGDLRHVRVSGLVQMCDHHLTSKSLREARTGEFMEDWEPEVIRDRIKVLLQEHPELAEWVRV